MAIKSEVWAWLPRDHQGRVAPAAAEVLYEARGLARRLSAKLVALTDRKPDPQTASLLDAWDVDGLRALAGPIPPHPAFQGGASPLAELDPAAPPRALLLVADTFGKVAAPLWAEECGATLVTGATGVTADGDDFVVARSTHGDQFEGLVSVPLEHALVVTLLPGAVGRVAPPAGAPGGPWESGEQAGEEEAPPEGTRIFPPHPAGLALEDAERIVAFGRGAFNREAIALVERLAGRLGAVVAGTRPAADEGWLPFSRQVGLTGAVVHPRLYVAVGISGAPYHMAGVKEPENLVAINSDPEAPIFGSAKLGIVGDLYEVLPRLIAELEQGRGLAGVSARPQERVEG